MLTLKTLVIVISTGVLGACSAGSPTEKPAQPLTISNLSEFLTGSASNNRFLESDPHSMANTLSDTDIRADTSNSPAEPFSTMGGIGHSSEIPPASFTVITNIDKYGTLIILK